MRKTLILAAFSLLAVGAFAQGQGQSDDQSKLPRDERTKTVKHDLHTIARIAALAENLDREKQVLLAIVDSDIKDLRIPRDDGTYQWASLQREEGGRVKDEKTIEHVYTEKELRKVTVSGSNGYRVEVNVPKKRGTFSANNRVWVGTVHAEITGFDGKVTMHDVTVNNWVNPGDSEGGPLPSIGKSVKATVELGVESGSKQAVAEVALVQAKLVDDAGSPYFPAVTRLLQIRELITARDINRGQLKNVTDEALLTLPGELDHRIAAQEEAARVRKMMAEAGTTTGTIHVGDATPDVIVELTEIARLSAGTVQEQADARARLEKLIAMLKPAPVQ